MTVAIKTEATLSPQTSLEGDEEAKNKLPVCSHLNATFSCDLCEGRKALWENIFQLQQLAAIYIIWGENRWNKYLTGLL